MSSPTREQLRVQFELYNWRFFRGKLVMPALHRTTSQQVYGDYTRPYERYPHGLLRISTALVPPAGGWRGILLHEMAHHALLTAGHAVPDDASTDEWHDAAFTRLVNRLGRALGLPRVAQSEAWAWPWGGMVQDDLHDLFD